MTDEAPTPTSPDPARRGWGTSEYWLVLLATALVAVQPLVIDPTWQSVVIGVLAVLGALGYSANRTSVKQAAIRASAPTP